MLPPAMQWYTEWIILLLFTGAAFFFAVAETALLTLGKWRLRQVTAHSPERAVFIRKLLATPQDLLATMTLGNTLAHGAIIATVLAISLQVTERHFLWVTLALAAGLLLFCEVVPKSLAMRHPEAWAPRVAFPMLWIMQISRPIRGVAQGANNLLLRLLPNTKETEEPPSDEEYTELLELGWQSGTLGASEREIILNIMALDRRSVADLMRPRSQMTAIPHQLSVPEMLAAARDCQHRRIPLYDESPDTIVGILNTPQLLADPEIDMVEVIDFPSFVPEEMNLLELLKSFQRGRHGMAIVLDEFGGTAGLITIEDILEELVGEMREEGEQIEFTVEKLHWNRWRVNGTLPIEDFQNVIPELKAVPEVDTMGGLFAALNEVVPKKGESLKYCALELTVVSADERRVKELIVKRLTK